MCVKHWLAKISLLIAVMLITAHNVIPHDHVAQSTAHEHHQHSDKEKVFSHDLLAHSFVQRSAEFDLAHQLTVEAPVALVPEVTFFITTVSHPVFAGKIFYTERGNLPPPLHGYSSISFRGPPVTA